MTIPALPAIDVVQAVVAAVAGLVMGIGATYAVMRRGGRASRGAAASVPEAAPNIPEVRGPLPPAARRLIEIRDHLVGGSLSPELATVIYTRLGSALDDLGVRTVEGTGPVDWEQQEAVGTQPTADRALDQTVASSVRPGYRFGDAVVRPQEVIVYVARSAGD